MPHASFRLFGTAGRADFGRSLRVIAFAGFAVAFVVTVASSHFEAHRSSCSDGFFNNMPLP
jgi:hypothetical protein